MFSSLSDVAPRRCDHDTLVVFSKEDPATGQFLNLVQYVEPARDAGKRVCVNPMFDRTNAHNRLLAKGSMNVADDFSPEFLVYSEGGKTRLGTNLAVAAGRLG
jgi:hypothetical protein